MPSLGCGCALLGSLLLVGLVISVGTVVLDDPHAGPPPEEVEGIPPVLLEAYTRGPEILDSQEHAQCTGMRWSILAGVGAVESDHGATVEIDEQGNTDPPFIGPRLDGSGEGGNLTPHFDTDDGRWDDDTEYDRAVGVTQHLPANWSDYGVDATGSGEADPHNVYDSVASTAVELCQSAQGEDVDFDDRSDLEDALFRYNPADWYVDEVMAEIEGYDALTLAEGSDEGGSQAGHQAVEWALDQVGLPYVWGGNGAEDGGLDCSGLTQQAWAAAGVDIPRVTTDQYQIGTRVGLDELAPGDLLFYDTSDEGGIGEPPTHVTMYVGEGQMINAPRTGEDVRVEPVDGDYYPPVFMGAVRPGK